MDDLQALKRYAASLLASERLEEARIAYERICTARPHDIDGVVALAAIAGRLGRYTVAEEYARRAVALRPNLAIAHTNLGNALNSQGRVDEALEAFRRAVAITPKDPQARFNLGKAFLTAGQWDEALRQFRRALRARPAVPEFHYAFAIALEQLGRIDEADVSYTRAVRINPHYVDARLALARRCWRCADPEGVIEHLHAVVRTRPDSQLAHSDLLMVMNYLPDADSESLFRAHCAWAASLPAPQAGEWVGGLDAADPNRCVRVGYVSPDFRTHSVSYFIRPLLEFHDPSEVEIVCYSDVLHPDATTQELAALAVEWRDTSSVSSDDFRRIVRQDRIDVLVDLAGHTARSRLREFAHGLAPIQVSYLGYPNTTGLRAMHYRLTDSLTDLPGQDVFYTEQLVRLPGCFLCYRPPMRTPPVTPGPAQVKGYVTFGSFNSQMKINREVISLWAELLQAVPGSHLFLKAVSVLASVARRRVLAAFADAGVSADRVELQGPTSDLSDHLSLYEDVASHWIPSRIMGSPRPGRRCGWAYLSSRSQATCTAGG